MGWLLAVCIWAADGLDDVARHLAQPAILHGHFIQDKTLDGFTRPLHSSGSFVLVRDRGILWDTAKPFASTLTVTRERISGARGASSTVYAQGQTVVGTVNRILFALLGGDVGALRDHFSIAGHRGMPWELVLTPRDGVVASVIAQVTLRGDRYVEHVVWVEPNGDRSTLTLQDMRTDPLSAQEAARLDQK